jgi:hypothetical protein
MTLNSHINKETERFGDEWGFYIDIDNETVKTVPDNEDIIRKKYSVKKYRDIMSYNDNDQYDYYIKNYNTYDDDVSIAISAASNNCSDKINYNLVSNIVRVSSTTIITAAITYVIFFVL